MLSKFGAWVIKQYRFVIVLALIITLVSIYGASKIKLETEMKDMMPKDDPQVKIFDHALNNFTGMEILMIAVEGEKQDIIAYIKELAPKLDRFKGVNEVTYQAETEFIEKNGLLLAGDPEDLKNMSGMLTAASLRDFIKGLNDNFETTYTDSGDSKQLSKDKTEMMQMLTILQNFVMGITSKTISDGQIIELSNEFIRGGRYLISHDETMGLILLRTSIDLVDMETTAALIDGLKELSAPLEKKYNVNVGYGGNLAIQRDEMFYTEQDMRTTGILSLVLILLIFYIGFRVVRFTLLAIVPLILGIIWVFGITGLTIGSLNLMTSMMVAILIGLGIDYSIHVISIYTEMRSKGLEIEPSLQAIYEKVAKGVITGSVTTALGFYIFMLSSFDGFKEFGFVLGTGIICTLAASIIVLPAVLRIFHFKPMKLKNALGEEISVVEKVLTRHAKLVIFVVLIALIISASGMPRVRFTRDWLDIEPVGMPSIETGERINDKFDFSSYYSLFISRDLDTSDKLKEELEDLSTVGLVDSLSQYIPEKAAQGERMAVVNKIKKQVLQSPSPKIYPTQLQEELFRLKANLIELSDLAYIGGEKKLVAKLDNVVKSKVIDRTAEDVYRDEDQIKHFQKFFISNLQKKVKAANASSLITLKDVPKNIRETYIGKDGTYLTMAYPTDDPWQYDYQQIHLKQLAGIKSEISTGSMQLIIRIMEIAGREGLRILIYTAIFIYLVLLLDFRSLKYATFAMLPMGLTMVMTLGIMGWTGMTFNFVNIIALPLIIGIGVDDGVHLIHRYLIENKIGPAITSTGRAITLTTLTTMAAFGTMMIAKYRGFASFAYLIVIGIGLAYLTTMVLLPALIVIFDKKRMNNNHETTV